MNFASWQNTVFDDLSSKKSSKSMVLRTFNFWRFVGQYRDFHYYYGIRYTVVVGAFCLTVYFSRTSPFDCKLTKLHRLMTPLISGLAIYRSKKIFISELIFMLPFYYRFFKSAQKIGPIHDASRKL